MEDLEHAQKIKLEAGPYTEPSQFFQVPSDHHGGLIAGTIQGFVKGGQHYVHQVVNELNSPVAKLSWSYQQTSLCLSHPNKRAYQ